MRYFFYATNSGSRFTVAVKEHFTEYVKKAASQFVNEKVSDFLDSVKAVQKEGEKAEENENPVQKNDGINTTKEELEGYQIVRAIVCQKIAPGRVAHRDTKSYFGILVDDNNRKPICRLHFNTSQKYIGIFDKDKKETRYPINEVTDIYQFAKNSLESIDYYEEDQ